MNAYRRRPASTCRRVRCRWALLPLLTVAAPCLAQTAPSYSFTPAPAVGPHEDEFSNPANWYGLDAPTSPEYELDEILAPHTGMFTIPLVSDATDALIVKQRELQEATGLRVGFFYSQLYQQASGGPNTRWGMAGDADLLFDWTLVGRGTANTGRFVFSAEDRFKAFSEVTPAQLRNEIGTLVATTSTFNDRGLVIRDAFWDQRLFDAKLRLLAGRAAPDDYVGSHRLQSAVVGFFNGNLSSNVTMVAPGHGPLALVSVHPTDLFYATGGAANAYGTTTQITVDELFEEGKVYGFGEVGLTPTIPGLGAARYAVNYWYMPERALLDLPYDSGMSITLEQYVAKRWWFYGRYGFSQNGGTGIIRAWQAGMAIDGLLGSPDNLTGIGFGYAEPTTDGLRDEKSIEVFQRFQVTQHTQFTVGAELFVDPSNAPEDNVLAVFSFRLRVDM